MIDQRKNSSNICRQSDAVRAIQSMDGQTINGRSLQVSQRLVIYLLI